MIPLARPLLRRRPAPALAFAVSLAVLALALVAPSQGLARAHKASCRLVSTHLKHHASGCTKAGHRAKGHGRRAAKRHLAAPAVTTSKASVRASLRTRVSGTAPAGAPLVPATCEDGSAPQRVGDEIFECEDGSEPRCDTGSSLTLSSDGATLLCAPGSQTVPSSGEGTCEPASSPGCGSPPVEDGGEPACEEGSNPSQTSSAPALTCPAPGGEAPASAKSSPHSSAGPSGLLARAS
jgi:hypothetical protein